MLKKLTPFYNNYYYTVNKLYLPIFSSNLPNWTGMPVCCELHVVKSFG